MVNYTSGIRCYSMDCCNWLHLARLCNWPCLSCSCRSSSGSSPSFCSKSNSLCNCHLWECRHSSIAGFHHSCRLTRRHSGMSGLAAKRWYSTYRSSSCIGRWLSCRCPDYSKSCCMCFCSFRLVDRLQSYCSLPQEQSQSRRKTQYRQSCTHFDPTSFSSRPPPLIIWIIEYFPKTSPARHEN
jgi:hypothetical protein